MDEAIEQLYRRLEDEVRGYDPGADLPRIRAAFEFAEAAHRGQLRASGEPYIIHPAHTALNLAEMKLPQNMIIAGLLHDVPEDTPVTIDQVREKFGDDVAKLVSGITKVGTIKYRGVERYIENLRKMFLTMAEDVRVVIIKFADRLHNLETLGSKPAKKQYRIALESLEIYAPIANRLGMGDIKGRLEDAAFPYVLPKEYEWTRNIQQTALLKQKDYLDKVMRLTRELLDQTGLKYVDVHGRVKHLFSLYRKLLKHERNIAGIHDIMAIRVIVPSIADCYAALGVIHGKWTPLKGRIKDYIAQPKPNGYRSLHTTVFCEDGEVVEFQIRTEEMHLAAEFGIAAHWSYDEQKIQPAPGTGGPSIDWVTQLADIQREISDRQQYFKSLEEIKIDLFKDRIFVFTPKGDVIDLPEGSTPVDFAYLVHTDIGNKCTGVRINDDHASLDRTLKSGDVVEIIIDKSRKGPNPDWLKFVKTRHARSKIRQYARSSISSWISSVIPSKLLKK